jgi:TnpA family transposase
LDLIRRRTGEQNRLGFAILLCSLRFIGFIPENLETIPAEIIQYLAGQIIIDEKVFPGYQRVRTRQTQIQEILIYTNFRRAEKADLETLEKWLMQRALEHDKPSFLLRLAIEKLFAEKIFRPGLSVLERLVLKSREEAVNETYRLLLPTLDGETKTIWINSARSRKVENKAIWFGSGSRRSVFPPMRFCGILRRSSFCAK